jgi:hypothetical protein
VSPAAIPITAAVQRFFCKSSQAIPFFAARLCRPPRFGQHSRAKPTGKEFTEGMLHYHLTRIFHQGRRISFNPLI